jgi:outer membrane protein W
MRRAIPASLGLAFALLAPPAAAQMSTEVGVLGACVHSTTTTVTDATYDVGVKFRSGAGAGLYVDVRPWRQVSLELSGFFTRQSGAITANGDTLVSAGSLEAFPIVLEAKFHPLGNGTVDPYVGVGGAWVSFHDLTDTGLDAAGIGPVTVKSKAGFAASVGARFALSPKAAFVFDAKYLAVKPKSRAGSGPETELRWNPLLVSVGFGYRF